MLIRHPKRRPQVGSRIHECGVRNEVRRYELGIFGRETIFKTQGEGFDREEKGTGFKETSAKGLRKTGQWGVRKIRTKRTRSYEKKVLQEGRNGICSSRVYFLEAFLFCNDLRPKATQFSNDLYSDFL